MNIQKIFKGMTDGCFVNIGNAENLSYLENELFWQGIYLNELPASLYDALEQNRAGKMLHYFTVHEKIDILPVLQKFFDKVNNTPGWKFRIILMRVPHSEDLTKYLLNSDYTFVESDENYDYFIHTIWDVLI